MINTATGGYRSIIHQPNRLLTVVLTTRVSICLVFISMCSSCWSERSRWNKRNKSKVLCNPVNRTAPPKSWFEYAHGPFPFLLALSIAFRVKSSNWSHTALRKPNLREQVDQWVGFHMRWFKHYLLQGLDERLCFRVKFYIKYNIAAVYELALDDIVLVDRCIRRWKAQNSR